MARDERQARGRPPVPALCQSCGRLMETLLDLGTGRSGERIVEYCVSCYRNGAFTEPTVSMIDLVNRRADRIARELGRPRSEIVPQLIIVFNSLGRWYRKASPSERVGPDTRRLRQIRIEGK